MVPVLTSEATVSSEFWLSVPLLVRAVRAVSPPLLLVRVAPKAIVTTSESSEPESVSAPSLIRVEPV